MEEMTEKIRTIIEELAGSENLQNQLDPNSARTVTEELLGSQHQLAPDSERTVTEELPESESLPDQLLPNSARTVTEDLPESENLPHQLAPPKTAIDDSDDEIYGYADADETHLTRRLKDWIRTFQIDMFDNTELIQNFGDTSLALMQEAIDGPIITEAIDGLVREGFLSLAGETHFRVTEKAAEAELVLDSQKVPAPAEAEVVVDEDILEEKVPEEEVPEENRETVPKNNLILDMYHGDSTPFRYKLPSREGVPNEWFEARIAERKEEIAQIGQMGVVKARIAEFEADIKRKRDKKK